MIIALLADSGSALPLAEGLEARGNTCLFPKDSIPGEADCLIVVGDPGKKGALADAAEGAGLPVLRIPAAGAAEAAAAAVWGLGLAERRVRELVAANELLVSQDKELKETLVRLDGANREFVEEFNLASELQKSLLPRSYPSDAPLEFAHKFIPLNSIGGDFFDVLRLDERTLGMVIADVSGHGVGPALVTALLKSSFGLHCRDLRSPAALMTALNEELGNVLTTGHYVTAFAAIIDIESLELRYCSAGHPNQLLIKANGESQELSTMGFLLGMMGNMDYEEKCLVLDPGDTLVLFTDGVFESPDMDGKLFGREGILRSVLGRMGSGVEQLSDGLLSDLLSWTQGTEASDDVTILITQVIESL
ncbi:MAG: PP2C family protein-serine/threonine phosphatase [Rectinemataceae bacterium]|jgi:serine phosphatase RsbU (regulator of sigma subunit)